jgi:hypothetical protein
MDRPVEQTRACAAIEGFLKVSRQPVLLEPGEEPLSLEPDNYTLEWRSSGLTLQTWDRTRNFVRRIKRVGEEKLGKLELIVERFGKREGHVFLLDLARPKQLEMKRRGTRMVFREQFRRSLSRRFPDWRIAELSTEANLQESLSPVYPRALLKKGGTGWAALAAPRDAGAASGALTFGLIWLDYLRRRETRLTIEGLALFLAYGQHRGTCLRLPFLNPRAAQYAVFVYSEEGYEERLDPRDYGNLDTRLEPCRAAFPARDAQVEGWIERLCRSAQVERIECSDGSASLRVRGLEFARATRTELLFGLDQRVSAGEANLAEIEWLAAEIARVRAGDAADREHPLYRWHPEAWLESQVRGHLEQIDASLWPAPLYAQAPSVAAGERGVMDLLAVDRDGRLAVLELKASEDIQLPLQALDYWMRVKWHLDRGEFSERGYFPGIALRGDAPRLLLMAPALDFHPKTEVILRHFSREVEVERIGLGVEWRMKPKVMFRIQGAERPH